MIPIPDRRRSRPPLACFLLTLVLGVLGGMPAAALAQDAPEAGQSGAEPSFETVPVETIAPDAATTDDPAAAEDTSEQGGAVAPLDAAEAAASGGGVLRVGVEPRAPYAIEGEAGWTGIAVDGWRLIAEDLGVQFEWVPLDARGGAQAIAEGRVDLALPIDATPEAAEAVAFTAPLHTATIGVAGGPRQTPLDVAAKVLNWKFARIVFFLAILLLIVGAIVWLLERRKNSDMFGGGTVSGLGDGFWWAGVTLTTIGYGDKAPATFGGRAVAMVWMLVGLGISSALTAAVVSATGVGSAAISVPEDLRGTRVAARADTAAARFLDAGSIPFEPIDEIDDALRLLDAERLDAVVALAPVLEERVNALDLDVPVARTEREPHLVSIAVPREGLAERAEIERAVLRLVTSPGWSDVLERYLDR